MTTVFNAIVSDLEAAIALLPVTVSSSEVGRANKAVASALLGKVYLYWADLDNDNAAKFQLAAQHLQQVVDFGIYQLEDNYQDLFTFGTKNPVESVFEAQHSNLFPSDWVWFEGTSADAVGVQVLSRGFRVVAW